MDGHASFIKRSSILISCENREKHIVACCGSIHPAENHAGERFRNIIFSTWFVNTFSIVKICNNMSKGLNSKDL